MRRSAILRPWLLLLTGLASVLWAWLLRDQPFFWDTIQLSSKQAQWYYANDFRYLLLPDRIDSGHPPAMGGYLAAGWKLFGRSLTVSHLLMVPWLWLLLYQLWRWSNAVVPQATPWLFALLVVDPVLLGQAALVSPDLILMGAFLLGLNAIVGERGGWLLPAVLLLGLISMRGMVVGGMLYVMDVLYRWQTDRDNIARWAIARLRYYLPGGLLALAFLVYHYLVKGWIGHHADSPWAPSFATADAAGMLRNVAIVGWRWLEVGRVWLWLALLGWLLSEWKHWWPGQPRAEGEDDNKPTEPHPDWWTDRQLQWLALSGLIAAAVLAWPALRYHSLAAQRYFLPAYLLFGSLVGYVVLKYGRARYTIMTLLILGLLAGNLWIYPDRVAQGWDATLAHLPYADLRRAAIGELDRQQIPLAEVGTEFPEIGPLDERDLSGRTAGMTELAQQRYVLYSNVMNGVSDSLYLAWQQHWKVHWQRERCGVRVVIYERLD